MCSPHPRKSCDWTKVCPLSTSSILDCNFPRGVSQFKTSVSHRTIYQVILDAEGIGHSLYLFTMERVLPSVVSNGIEKMIEFAYSFEPYFAPTVCLGKWTLFVVSFTSAGRDMQWIIVIVFVYILTLPFPYIQNNSTSLCERGCRISISNDRPGRRNTGISSWINHMLSPWDDYAFTPTWEG